MLAEKLATLLEDADRLRAMGEAGRTFTLGRFDVKVMIDALERVYAVGTGVLPVIANTTGRMPVLHFHHGIHHRFRPHPDDVRARKWRHILKLRRAGTQARHRPT